MNGPWLYVSNSFIALTLVHSVSSSVFRFVIRKCLAAEETVAVAPAASAAAAAEGARCTLTWDTPRPPPPTLSQLSWALLRRRRASRDLRWVAPWRRTVAASVHPRAPATLATANEIRLLLK